MARQLRRSSFRPRLSVSQLEDRGEWLSRGELLSACDELWSRATETQLRCRGRANAIMDALLLHIWVVDCPPVRASCILSLCLSFPGDVDEPNRVSRSAGGGFDYCIGGAWRTPSPDPVVVSRRCFSFLCRCSLSLSPSLFLVVVSLSPSLLVASPSMTYTRYNIPSRRA